MLPIRLSDYRAVGLAIGSPCKTKYKFKFMSWRLKPLEFFFRILSQHFKMFNRSTLASFDKTVQLQVTVTNVIFF